jgi:large subunit ribosomal protein L2
MKGKIKKNLISDSKVISSVCYQNNLQITGNCRICLVKLNNFPKPVISYFLNNKVYYDNIVLKKKTLQKRYYTKTTTKTTDFTLIEILEKKTNSWTVDTEPDRYRHLPDIKTVLNKLETADHLTRMTKIDFLENCIDNPDVYCQFYLTELSKPTEAQNLFRAIERNVTFTTTIDRESGFKITSQVTETTKMDDLTKKIDACVEERNKKLFGQNHISARNKTLNNIAEDSIKMAYSQLAQGVFKAAPNLLAYGIPASVAAGTAYAATHSDTMDQTLEAIRKRGPEELYGGKGDSFDSIENNTKQPAEKKMKLKFLKPTTPSQRHVTLINKKHLAKKPIIKTKLKGLKNQAGRNNSGKITVFHKGNGHKKKYRLINFNRTIDSSGIVCSIEYDPNRNTNIASIYDLALKNFYYIIAPENLTVGTIIKSGPHTKPNNGNSLPIYKIPTSYFIHNISQKSYKKAQIARSAGTYAILKEKTAKYATLKLPSGEKKIVSLDEYATIGIVSNENFLFTQNGKAGRSRWLNKRPTVRGVAMNPIDHPHGGGEGKTSGKALTPWSKPTKKGSKKK